MELTSIKKTKTLDIKPSSTSSENDFDFLQGKWKVHNRMLKSRLANSDEWIEFEAELHMKKTLNGFGNIENFYSNNNGTPFEGMAIRLFNKETKLWKIYWVDSNGTTMDEKPVTGSYENGLGRFYANDVFNNQEILVLYQWDATNPQQPKWSQAFSTDNGRTWEWNWKMELTRIE
ncbi:hypothetical protein [Flavobacterium humi]|uniref:DUF1579 domain-containing protein n=1 Tax=Flavobacterium humi TaxID=2562683 RepID=A0A4Z0L2I2_9FLAO|nr:hypothetical protein [Flavobacterium humi]TGD56643.1 hypothetical protein E4635_14450 [Flavobacterium humi]